MMAEPKTHHCDKCGRVVDPKTCTTLNLQEHWVTPTKHWISGIEYEKRRTRNLMPQVKLCSECTAKTYDMLEGWLKE